MTETTSGTKAPSGHAELDAGTYEVLRARLAEQPPSSPGGPRRSTPAPTCSAAPSSACSAPSGSAPRTTACPATSSGRRRSCCSATTSSSGSSRRRPSPTSSPCTRSTRDGDAFRFDAVATELPGLLDRRRVPARLRRAVPLLPGDPAAPAPRASRAGCSPSSRPAAHRGHRACCAGRSAPTATLTYMDDRGERDHVFPPAHDFEWIATTRDDHVPGRHPHISIAGRGVRRDHRRRPHHQGREQHRDRRGHLRRARRRAAPEPRRRRHRTTRRSAR